MQNSCAQSPPRLRKCTRVNSSNYSPLIFRIFSVHDRSFCSVNLSNSPSKSTKDELCTVEPDPNKARSYLIYIQNGASNEKKLFGQLTYNLCSYDNYLYTIVIGRKLYKVRSSDLKDRRLALIDTIEQNNHSSSNQCRVIQCPETLFQVIDSFSKLNKNYHVTINDKDKHIGYLAIVILLDLHENKRH